MHGASEGVDQSIAMVVQRIAGYLRANPQAGDTTDGVAQWWLGRSTVSTELVEQALRWLESEGLLEAVRAADGRVHFRRASLEASIDARLDQLIAGSHEPRQALD
jgi:hypothetical protein